MKKILFASVGSSLATLLLVYSLGAASPVSREVVLENVRVVVTERSIPPGGVRESYIRPSDQVIVFLNETSYDRIDPKTGDTITRHRKAGEVIWHSRGELAPRLVNAGSGPMRSLVIAVK